MSLKPKKERRKFGTIKVLEEITTKIFQTLVKDINLHIQETLYIPKKIKVFKMHKHIIVNC